MLRYAITITLSAFLLFQVQPLIARFVLPWFGGTPAVWTTCMLFFQVVLLAGYAYAHLLDRWLSPRWQAMLHTGLLIAACVVLPIIPSESWKPTGDEWPTGQILLLLLASIGLPYGLVSTTGPLLQAWYRRRYPTRSPYRLFALSNAGSLVALVTYPFLFEPNLRLDYQAYLWSGGFVLFAILCAFCGWTSQQVGEQQANEQPEEGASTIKVDEELGDDSLLYPQTTEKPAQKSQTKKPSWSDVSFWLVLSIFPSVLLLATTSQLSQEVAVVPFLWVLPLSLYLLTFIICFDSPRWYRREIFLPLTIFFNIVAALSLSGGVNIAIWVQMLGFAGALFTNAMCCHGELARMKPDPKYLTLFYLIVSLGGAMGGMFVVLVAPIIFNSYFELHFGIAACFGFAMAAYLKTDDWMTRRLPLWLKASICGALTGATAIYLLTIVWDENSPNVIEQSRDFYGTLTVTEYQSEKYGAYRRLRNGRILHGFQFVDPDKRLSRTSYYAKKSGVGLAILQHPRMKSNPDEPMKLGVVGLGTGALAAYGEAGDTVRFYEINPDVVRIARSRFFYISDSPATVEVVLGDARIQMEREIESGDRQQFDVLAIDAFSSDAIPMHLLTKECFEVYLEHLKPDGILAIHISNRYLDLEPVVYSIGRELGFERPVLADFDPEFQDGDPFDDLSEWALLTKNKEFLDDEFVNENLTAWTDKDHEVIWTDNYGSIWQVMREMRWDQLQDLVPDD